MALVLGSLFIPAIYAQDADDVQIDTQTQSEVECMEYEFGASIRLLQLEKAITTNIIKGEEVIAVLQTSGYNTISLEAILAEFELLLAEVQAVDPNATDAVQVFVDLKSDAVDLSKEYRDTLHELVDEGTKEMLRLRIRDMVCAQNLSIMIKNQTRQFNRNQLYAFYVFLGETNMCLIDEYQKGNMTLAQVRTQIRERINNMTKEHRNDVFFEIGGYRVQNRLQTQVCLKNVTHGFQERKETRLTLRLHLGLSTLQGQIRTEFENQLMNRINRTTDSGGQQSGGDSGDDNGYGEPQGPGGSGK